MADTLRHASRIDGFFQKKRKSEKKCKKGVAFFKKP